MACHRVISQLGMTSSNSTQSDGSDPKVTLQPQYQQGVVNAVNAAVRSNRLGNVTYCSSADAKTSETTRSNTICLRFVYNKLQLKRRPSATVFRVMCVLVHVCVLWTDQTKGSQDRKSLDVLQAKLNKTKYDNDEVKTAPFVLEILVEPKRDDLEDSFDGENARKHLQPIDNSVNSRAIKCCNALQREAWWAC